MDGVRTVSACRIGDEGIPTGYEHLSASDNGLDEQQCYSSDLHKETGRYCFLRLCSLVKDILIWAEQFSVFPTARYILGKKNIIADQLTHPDQVPWTKWSLLLQVLDDICREFGHSHIYLFTAGANTKLHLYVSPISDPMAWNEDTFHHSWNILSVYAFLPFGLLRQVLLRVLISQNLTMILISP